MPSESIFSVLAKYNSATDENYLTESLVFVINALLQLDRPIGLEILTQLCVKDNEFSFDIGEDISVSTQEVTEQGTPDIKVSSPDKLIYIEVKDYSQVDPDQLKRYKKSLESPSVNIKQLILLTRFPVDSSEHQGIPDKHVRWFEVYNWLTNARTKTKDPVSVYLIDSFKSFLEAKQMSLQKVEREYIKGVPALNNLVTMLEVAIQGASVPIYSKSAGWDYKGFWLDNKKYISVIYYDNHLLITFEIADKLKYNKDLLKKPSYELREGRDRLWFRLPLEDKHFFSLDKDKQLEEITNFIRQCYTEAEDMRIKEQ